MLNANDVAQYFLFLSYQQQDEDEGISNMKLQKLLYYAQGFHLALYDTALFPEDLQAWMHGPVVPDVYHVYKINGRNAIPFDEDLNIDKFDSDTRDLLQEIHQTYGQFSAWGLRNITHAEPPWKEAEGQIDKTISHESLKRFFKTRIFNGEEEI